MEVSTKAQEIKNQIMDLIQQYHDETFAKQEKKGVPVSGKVFDHKELQLITESALDGWFTTGRFNKEFESKLKEFIGTPHLITVNSGSSANLVASLTLCAPELGERAIKPGDEFITVAASFPTTINPLISYGATPVFLDVEIPSYNIDVSKIEEAITEKTKAIVIAHTLGNPYDLEKIRAICDKYNLWLMEDSCDGLGSHYNGKHIGSFGDIATLSFYPAHHITMGEGGAVFMADGRLKKIAESLRDWGRDCWCPTGVDNTCGKRFGWQLGDLPEGYDHKYIYSRIGYNLKITDMQAALGLAQLEKLPSFVAKRRENFDLLKAGLEKFSDKMILPEAAPGSEPSWFGFLITLKDGINRKQVIDKLTEKGIGTRLLFAGDVRKQPYFKGIEHRTVGDLKNTETILRQTFWIGLAPMINKQDIDYVVNVFDEIF